MTFARDGACGVRFISNSGVTANICAWTYPGLSHTVDASYLPRLRRTYRDRSIGLRLSGLKTPTHRPPCGPDRLEDPPKPTYDVWLRCGPSANAPIKIANSIRRPAIQFQIVRLALELRSILRRTEQRRNTTLTSYVITVLISPRSASGRAAPGGGGTQSGTHTLARKRAPWRVSGHRAGPATWTA